MGYLVACGLRLYTVSPVPILCSTGLILEQVLLLWKAVNNEEMVTPMALKQPTLIYHTIPLLQWEKDWQIESERRHEEEREVKWETGLPRRMNGKWEEQ